MKIKLTISALKTILEVAERNKKNHKDASDVVVIENIDFDDDSHLGTHPIKATLKCEYAECEDYFLFQTIVQNGKEYK